MKKWYQWLFLSLGFCVGGALSCLDGRSIVASFIPAIVMALLAIVQFFCEKKGEKGKGVIKYISISAMALLVIWLLCLVFVQT